MLGYFYHEGLGISKDLKRALNFFQLSASHGNEKAKKACLSLNQQTTTSQNGMEAYKHGNFSKAMDLFTNEANRGDVNALFMLGNIYYKGKGTSVDYVKAIDYFQKAASKNHPSALYMLGICLLQGQGCVQDPHKARQYFQAAAQRGCSEAKAYCK